MPGVCSRHGEAEVERRRGVVRFHWDNRVRVQTTFGSAAAWGLRRLRRVPPSTATELTAEWPVCGRCVRQWRALRVVGLVLVLAGAVPLVVLLVGGFLGLLTPPRSPVVGVAFIPVWFPGLIAVACAAFDRASRYVRVRPIVGDTAIVLVAHPRFAEAVAAQGFS